MAEILARKKGTPWRRQCDLRMFSCGMRFSI
jgi:hypothetical protein